MLKETTHNCQDALSAYRFRTYGAGNVSEAVSTIRAGLVVKDVVKTAAEIDQITRASRTFRAAILASLPLSNPVMDLFPLGACRETSVLLGEYLRECNFGDWKYHCGIRDVLSHGWIEQDDLIVDITASQFVDVDEEVIVTYAKDWHNQFEPIGGNDESVHLGRYDDAYEDKMADLYRRILVAASRPEEH